MTIEVVPTHYGAPAVDALAGALTRAKGGEPLRPVTVVVPSNYAGVAARRALARRTGVVGVNFVTLYRLAELLAGPALAAGHRVPVSSPVVATAVRAVLADQPLLFGPVADQPATVEALRRVHRELRELSEPQLDHLARLEARAGAVVAIDRRVTARLRGRWFDETDLMQAATRRAGEAAIRSFGPVVVHLPQRIGVFAAELLLALAEQVTVTVVLGVTGDDGADRVPARVLARLGQPSAEPIGDVVAPTPPSGVQVERVIAADPDDEVRTALRRVVQAAAAGTRLERVVIAYGPGAPYGRLLADHLGAAGIAWNGVATMSLTERVAGRTILKAIDLSASGLPRHDVFALLSSLPASPDRPVAVWERHSRRAGVVAGPRQWDERLARLATELRARPPEEAYAGSAATPDLPDWRAREADEVDALRTWVATLVERVAVPGVPTWAAHAIWARRLQRVLLGPPNRRATWSPGEQRAADRVDRAVDRLERLDAVADGEVDLATFRAALEAELGDGVTTVGRLGEGVFVGPLALAVGVDADVVIVLGLVEGGLPGGLADDPLLSDRSRAATGVLTTARERREELQHQLLAVTGAAAQAVVASRPRADLRTGAARYRSRWLDQLAALGPPGPVHEHASFHSGLHDDLPAGSEQEVLLEELRPFAAGGRPLLDHPVACGDHALRASLQLVSARASPRFTEFDGNLAPVAREGVELLRDTAVSPTALEAWAACPFAYFLRFVLRVREIERPEDELSIRPVDRGDLVHRVLEDVVSEAILTGTVPAPEDPWPVTSVEALATRLQARGAEAVERGLVGRALHWRFDERRLGRVLDVFMDLDAQARREHEVRPVAVELVFGRDRPFVVELANGRGLSIAGKVDRVDVSGRRVVVIDYKTGAKRSAREHSGVPVPLQLPIYGLAARTHLGLETAEVIGEYWHLHHEPKKRGRILFPVDDAEQARLREVLEVITDGIAGGVFVLRPDAPDPWRPWVPCAPCDPDGAGTATVWSQWRHKRGAPELRHYVELVEPESCSDEVTEEVPA